MSIATQMPPSKPAPKQGPKQDPKQGPKQTLAAIVAAAQATVTTAKAEILATAARQITETAQRSLENRFVLVKPRCMIPSNSRISRKIVERSAAAGGPVAEAARASVKIFSDDVLGELRDVRGDVTDYLNDVGFKTSDGMYIVHATRTLELAQKGIEYQKRYAVAADKFLQQYGTACDQWRDNLRGDADEAKYPDAEKLRTRLGLGANAERYGFRLEVTPIGGIAQKYQLDASEGELEYLQQTMRAQFDAVVGQGLKELETKLSELATSNTPGKRVKQAKLDGVRKVANKLRENGLLTGDVDAVVTRAEQAVAVPLPKHKKDRDGYVKNVAAVAQDLAAVLGGFNTSDSDNAFDAVK